MRKVNSDTLISVVIPIYNEVEVIDDLVGEVRETALGLDFPGQWEIVLVDDGSTDGSAEALDALAARYPTQVQVVHLARNFGHAAAVRAGLDRARGEAVVLMDGDLQDDPAAFGPFVAKWRAGYDVVYAIRTSRQERYGASMLFKLFYRVLSRLSEIELPQDAGNFSLMDRRVIDQLRSLPEHNRYLPGLRAWVGFRQVGVPVPRRARYDNSTRVGFMGLWKLANNAIFSFSHAPLTLFRSLGAIAILVSAVLMVYACYGKFISGQAIKAWMSQFSVITFFGGINLLGVGIIGEYVVRIYDEVKHRPAYVIDQIVTGDSPPRTVPRESEAPVVYQPKPRGLELLLGKVRELRPKHGLPATE